jgi:hypothetical protein
MNDPNLVNGFATMVTAENPLHTSFMKRSLRSKREDTHTELTAYLNYCLSAGLTLEYLRVRQTYDRIQLSDRRTGSRS